MQVKKKGRRERRRLVEKDLYGVEDSEVLTVDEWFALRSLLVECLHVVPLPCRLEFMKVLDGTVTRRRFATIWKNKKYVEEVCALLNRVNASNYRRRSRAALKNAHILQYYKMKSTKIYRINVPGLLEFLQPLSELTLHGEDPDGNVSILLAKVSEYWLQKGWPFEDVIIEEATMKKIEKVLEEERERAQDAKRSRSEKRAAQELKVTWVKEFIEEELAEIGEKYLEEWKSRTYGDVRNWLRYCQQTGRDPRETLRQVIQRWSYFRNEQLRTEKGVKLLLRPTMTFSQFYRYRELIYDWLAGKRIYGAGCEIEIEDLRSEERKRELEEEEEDEDDDE